MLFKSLYIEHPESKFTTSIIYSQVAIPSVTQEMGNLTSEVIELAISNSRILGRWDAA